MSRCRRGPTCADAMKGECPYFHPKCKFGSNCTKVLLGKCAFKHPKEHRKAPTMVVKPGTVVAEDGAGIIKCSGVSNGTIKFSDMTYDIWYMGSSDPNGGVHASINIAAKESKKKSIKCSWAKACSNLLIHRLPGGIHVQCCRSYPELKKCLKVLCVS